MSRDENSPGLEDIGNSELHRLFEVCAQKEAWKLHKEVFEVDDSQKNSFFVEGFVPRTPPKKAAPARSAPPRQGPRPAKSGRKYIIDSGASLHMISESSLLSSEKETIRPMVNPRRIQTANGIIEVNREAYVYVEDLEIWVWAMLVVDSPAVISLGVLCQEYGFTYLWKAGQRPKLSKGSKVIYCVTENFVPAVTISVDKSTPAEDVEVIHPAEGDLQPRPPAGKGSGETVPLITRVGQGLSKRFITLSMKDQHLWPRVTRRVTWDHDSGEQLCDESVVGMTNGQ